MPRLDPVRFGKGKKQAFRLWLQEELRNTISDRRPVEKNWERQLEDWRAKLPDAEAEFPFVGASNAVFPLVAIHTDPVYSDFMATFHASKNFFNASPRRGDRIEHANAIREGLAHIVQDHIKMRDVNKVGFLYNTVLGTAIYKDHWIDETRARLGYDETGKATKLQRRIYQPKIETVPLQHFYIPANAWEIDPDAPVGGAQWVAQKFYRTTAQLKAETQSDGLFMPPYNRDATERVVQQGEVEKDEPTDDFIQSEDDFEPFRDRKVELFEVWARFDVDGDGIEEDIVVIFHLPTLEILRATYNPFLHGKRPFEAIRYLPTFGFYGMGIAEIDDWAQHIVTRLMNAQVDNVLLSNTRMWGIPKGSSVLPDEPMYPGKMWMLGPQEEVQEIRMSDIYQSLPLTIQQFIQFGQLRSGVSELRQGDVQDLPSRTPAATTLAALREGSKRFDMIVNNMREPFGRMGTRLLQNMAQFIPEDPERWISYLRNALGPNDAQLVLEVLNQSPDRIADEFGITVSATSALANSEIEKQSFLAVMQLMAQMYPQMLQTLQVAEATAGTPTGQAALAAFSGVSELARRLLERFDIQNPEEYLPDSNAIEQQLGGAQPQTPGLPLGTGPVPPIVPAPVGGGAF